MMKKILIVLCHPDPRSFNHAVAASVRRRIDQAGCAIIYHDLYEERFDPLLGASELRRRFSLDTLVQRHYHDLETADGVVVIHPDWWSQPPAMLKGWIDRVLAPGIGYEFVGEEFMPKHKVALLAGKRVLVLATTDAEAPAGETRSEGESSPGGQVALLESLWRATFAYCGISDFHFRMLYGMRTVEPTERREWLDRVAGEAFALFAT